MDKFFYCGDIDTRSIKQLEVFVGNGFALIQEETASVTWRHVPSQFILVELISRGIKPSTLSKGPQWLSQEPSS